MATNVESPTKTNSTAGSDTSAGPGLDALVAAAKAGRNRAVDAYRAVAMLAVAIGHWLVLVAYRDPSGELISGNGLEFVPGFRVATWVFQVLPLFFMVGGFASAASLDSKGMGGAPGLSPAQASTPRQRANWIAGRMTRLLPPVAALGAVWLVAIGVGYATGLSGLINAGAVAAAIPLWFLANYTADVILAPHVLPLFRRNPVRTAAIAGAVFLGLEVLRLSGENIISHANWILGWFLFQMTGFAWRDGLLPTGRRLVTLTVGLWAAAIALVALGPWTVSMVHVPGITLSPTYPPSLALLVFGMAQSATAIVFAPHITAWLERRAGAWKAVVAANSMAMSVYLWHMTAAVIALALFDQLGLLSAATPGSVSWFVAKIPFVAAAAVVLGLALPRLSRIEREALLSTRADWAGSPALLIIGAVVVSAALKGWTSGAIAVVIPCLVVVVAANHLLNRALTPER